jgi:hypothetical protein
MAHSEAYKVAMDRTTEVRFSSGTLPLIPWYPDRLRGPPRLLATGSGGSFVGDKAAGTQLMPLLHVVLRLRMRGAVPSLPSTCSCSGTSLFARQTRAPWVGVAVTECGRQRTVRLATPKIGGSAISDVTHPPTRAVRVRASRRQQCGGFLQSLHANVGAANRVRTRTDVLI